MQIKRKSSNRYSCNTKRCGQLAACVIWLLVAACSFILFNIQQQAQHKAHQESLRIQQEEATLAKQQAQMQEQQKRLQEEHERQAKEEDEMARHKAAQEALAQQRLVAKQREQYDAFMAELVQAEQKITAIAKLVVVEDENNENENNGQELLELASESLPKTLDGNDNKGQIDNIKVLVKEAEAKLKKLEQVMDP